MTYQQAELAYNQSLGFSKKYYKGKLINTIIIAPMHRQQIAQLAYNCAYGLTSASENILRTYEDFDVFVLLAYDPTLDLEAEDVIPLHALLEEHLSDTSPEE